jgi:hypothetical protein
MALIARAEPVLGQRIGAVPALACTAGMLALAVLSASAALGNALARRAPVEAAAIPPHNGFASAAAASALVARVAQGRESLAGVAIPVEVERLSQRALLAEPTAVQAVRNLGLYRAARGDTARARSLMRLAERLSRRDTVANMWLAEDALQRGELAPALVRIDAVLRTDAAAKAVVLPRLAAMLDLPGAGEVLGGMLASEPPWAHDFWSAVVTSGTSPRAAAELRLALHRRGAHQAPGHDAALIEQLVAAQAFAEALALREAVGGRGHFPPLDWRTGADPGVAVSLDGGGGLRVSARAGRGGMVAQRLVRLAGGAGMLRIASDGAPGALSARLACAELAGERTLALDIPLAGGAGRFANPTACRHAWLTLSLAPGERERDFTIAAVTLAEAAR